MSNYDDATNTLSDLECAVLDMRTTDLEDVNEALDNLDSKFNDHERELNYCSDDFEELERWRECGFDVEDIEGMEDQIADLETDLKAEQTLIKELKVGYEGSDELKIERDNLMVRNDTQRKIILACFAHLRELHSATSEEVIGQIIQAGNVPDHVLIAGPEGQGHA